MGRGWNNVYRELCQRFDRRAVKGWHLDGHVRGMVGLGGVFGRIPFLIDGRGILRRRARRPRVRRQGASFHERAQAWAWTGGRRVIDRGGGALFWTARPITGTEPVSAQGPALSPAEREAWTALPPDLRGELSYRPRAATASSR